MADKDKVARDILSDITVHMKYARYLPEERTQGDLGRRSWIEIKPCMLRNTQKLEEEINNAYQMVYNKKGIAFYALNAVWRQAHRGSTQPYL